MSNGVYLLHSKDGYRVAYDENYDLLFGSFHEETMDYAANPKQFKLIFGGSEIFPDAQSAIAAAKVICETKKDELDDGIMIISNYSHLSFEELIDESMAKGS